MSPHEASSGVPNWVPEAAAKELASAIGQDGATLRVVLDRDGGPLRELGSYLLLADRMYGRLRTGGLRRYAQLGGEQLQVTWWRDEGERLGLEIKEPVEAARGWRMALLWVALELLPEVVGADVAIPWAAARRRIAIGGELEPQVTLFAADSQDLLASAAERPVLAALSGESRYSVVEAVQDLYAEDSDLLPASIRFARERVAEVQLGE
ncbi:MAG: hypothetical protein ABFS34_16760 [Gemmatimonadota bacterium]